jgi:hypothetical protein
MANLKKLFFPSLSFHAILSVLAPLLCLAVFSGCEQGGSIGGLGTHEGLSAATEWRIIRDYIRDYRNKYGTPDPVRITKYYGTYNGCVAVMITSGPAIQASWDIIIADTLFGYADGWEITAWKAGRFYELSEAYERGLLTREDIRSIAYIHHGMEINLENHAGLRHHVGGIIRDTYLNVFVRPYYPESVLTDYSDAEFAAWLAFLSDFSGDFRMGYYGSYQFVGRDQGLMGDLTNDCVAVMMSSKYVSYDDTAWETAVAGIPFRYNDGNRILLWKAEVEDERTWQGRFYELQEAYDTGLLTLDDVRSIAYYHENGKAIRLPIIF